MSFRKLRIAWSVFWGLAAVLLIVLWVRSYYADSLYFICMPSRYVQVASSSGDCYFQCGEDVAFRNWGWDGGEGKLAEEAGGYMSFDWSATESTYTNSIQPQLVISQRVLVMVCVASVAIPWIPIRRQFSLRTLLIATTLIAVVLGRIVYLAN